jgi:hypothetical protein
MADEKRNRKRGKGRKSNDPSSANLQKSRDLFSANENDLSASVNETNKKDHWLHHRPDVDVSEDSLWARHLEGALVKKFAMEFLSNGGNGTKAAEVAAKTFGKEWAYHTAACWASQMLKRPEVQDEIIERARIVASATGVNAQWWVDKCKEYIAQGGKPGTKALELLKGVAIPESLLPNQQGHNEPINVNVNISKGFVEPVEAPKPADPEAPVDPLNNR